MKAGFVLFVALSAGLGAGLVAGCRTAAPFDAARRGSLAEDIIAAWPAPSRLAAAAMIEKYGPPDALAPDGMGWKDKGRWKKIIVRERPGESGGTAGILEQTAAYRVPTSARRELAAFGDKVRISPDGTAISARSDDEALNFLALNLAVAIGRGDLDAAGARDSYRRAVDLSNAGKSSALMKELLFPPIP
ncbi:MAG: hypothetical protein HYV14_06110 [Elusimicrobia bacterium]|nr:hypothetical protein [Elusimicrobiota bacterium]